jgi:hypothetical protein
MAKFVPPFIIIIKVIPQQNGLKNSNLLHCRLVLAGSPDHPGDNLLHTVPEVVV